MVSISSWGVRCSGTENRLKEFLFRATKGVLLQCWSKRGAHIPPDLFGWRTNGASRRDPEEYPEYDAIVGKTAQFQRAFNACQRSRKAAITVFYVSSLNDPPAPALFGTNPFQVDTKMGASQGALLESHGYLSNIVPSHKMANAGGSYSRH